ncbi:MAG TPA: hypothetical protein VJX69_13365 [Terriglobales bacterium]|nr:hypothetical protein [Terriglobales bacterium]
MNSSRFEADVLSGMDDLREQVSVVPDDPTDDPLFSYSLGKARDHNRFPARVMEADFIKAVSTGEVQVENVDPITGLPVKLEKISAAESFELSPEFEARLNSIVDGISTAATRIFQSRIAKMQTQPAPASAAPLRKAFKRVPLFDECTCAEEGRKCKACREKNVLRIEDRGNARIIHWEGGSTFETV